MANTYRQGQFVRKLSRLYLVHHHVDADTLAVYCVDDFGPYGSQVWIGVADLVLADALACGSHWNLMGAK